MHAAKIGTYRHGGAISLFTLNAFDVNDVFLSVHLLTKDETEVFGDGEERKLLFI